jgi:hypothetical protein
MGMQYTSTVLDRRTGELVSVDLGDFLTVTELGATLGLSPRKTRKVLHVLGLVEPEGGRGNYRLTRDAVNKGYGKRHDRPKHGKYPFDVLSPAGQKLVADGLDVALAQLEDRRVPKAQELRWSLEAYQAWRRAEKLSAMTLQMEVCWLADHFRDATSEEIIAATDGAAGMVRDYLGIRRSHHERQRAASHQVAGSF